MLYKIKDPKRDHHFDNHPYALRELTSFLPSLEPQTIIKYCFGDEFRLTIAESVRKSPLGSVENLLHICPKDSQAIMQSGYMVESDSHRQLPRITLMLNICRQDQVKLERGKGSRMKDAGMAGHVNIGKNIFVAVAQTDSIFKL